MAHLTPNELAALTAIDASEYGDYLTASPFFCSDATTPAIERFGSLLLSAIVNDQTFVVTRDMDGRDTVRMTDAGAAAYIAAVGTPRKSHGDA